MSLRSVRLSRALVATEVSGVCRFCGSGTWLPVRYGESWEAWRSLDVNVCQNARHWEVSEDAMVGCVSEPTAVVTVCQYASGGMDELPKDVRLAPAELCGFVREGSVEKRQW